MDQESAIGLEILREVARISSSTLDLDEILNKTIEVIKSRMRMDACSIYLMDIEGEEPRLKLRGSSGFPEQQAKQIYLKPGAGITGWVAENKSTLALSDAIKDPRFVYFPEIEEERFPSMLSVPLIDQEDCIGVINVHTKDSRKFNRTEVTILETISGQMTGCIRNAIAYSKSQLLLKEQTLLYDISMAVQETSQLDQRLWILLTGMTLGGGGGFNRAILFLVDEGESFLKGSIGLGPDSNEDAQQIWSNLESQKEGALKWILGQPDRNKYQQSTFHHFAQSLSIPLEHSKHIVSETALQKRPFIIQDASKDPLVPKDFATSLGVNQFATVPIMPQQEVLGVVLVDNRYNNEPITDSKIHLLIRLSTHMGWVLENSRLISKLLESNRELLSTKELLIQSEKLAALGELSAEVAHEIKNPLVSIGGFSRRLQSQLTKISKQRNAIDSIDSLVGYSNIIVGEVQRLETILKNILLFSKSDSLNFEDCPPYELVQEVVQLFEIDSREKNIPIQNKISENLPSIKVDLKRIKQVLINIFFNSFESMPQGGQINVSSLLPTSIQGEEMLGIIITDTGIGIDPETFQNIFNPFFTTKESGTGLGLSISRKIMESHKGYLEVKNNYPNGVSVYLYFPLQKSTECNKN